DFCPDSCDVRPNEEDKREHRDIDIYITNEKTGQAIIIENKIYAGDSTHEHKTGAEKIQLNRYRTIAEEEKFQSNQIFMVYLTLDRHDPERFNEINRPELLFKIDYPTEIISWLDLCIAITTNDRVKECIIQYRSIVTSLTSDLSRVGHLRRLINDNIDLSWDNISFIKEMPDFNHVKWHTIADFWNELASELENSGFEVTKRIDSKEITKIAHSQSKKSYGINVKANDGNEYYIVNDFMNGLTCGILHESKKWRMIQMIRFVEFEDRDVFQLINFSKRRALIDKTVSELKMAVSGIV
ncbi:MAG: PD-(D/E)XK nuclease family protein, partial [Bacteroidales bacterium]